MELVCCNKCLAILHLADYSVGIKPVNLSESQPDFWTSNCHKWLYTKRGSAVLYVPRRYAQPMSLSLGLRSVHAPEIIGSSPHPSLPHGGTYLLPRFNRSTKSSIVRTLMLASSYPFSPTFSAVTGTCDVTPLLSIVPALDFRESLGGEKKIMDYCDKLAKEGGELMAEILGTEIMDHNGELLNAMVGELPLPRPISSQFHHIGQCSLATGGHAQRSLERAPRIITSDDAGDAQ